MEKKTSLPYKLIKGAVRMFYPVIRPVDTDNLPDEPVIIVGNHSQMNGPIACELYVPGEHYIWCAGEMMELKAVPDYAYQDFWARKPKVIRWFYRLLSYVIAPLSVCVFNNANTIGVYHDARILSTFKQTVQRLQEGASVVIFPEHDVPYNHILRRFQDKFIDVAKLYYKRTGKAVCFVPMYLAPKLKKMYFGKPVRFDPEGDIAAERSRVCSYLMEEITAMACALPEHQIVPYRDEPHKKRPTNKGGNHEKTCG